MPVAETPNAEEQIDNPGSLLETVRSLIALHKSHPAFSADGQFKVIPAEAGRHPFVYLRTYEGESVLVAINPSNEPKRVELGSLGRRASNELLTGKDASLSGATIDMEGVSYEVFKLT